MFLVFNKEKIDTYLVAILTVAVLIGIASFDKAKVIPTSAVERNLPIYIMYKQRKKSLPLQ